VPFQGIVNFILKILNLLRKNKEKTHITWKYLKEKSQKKRGRDLMVFIEIGVRKNEREN